MAIISQDIRDNQEREDRISYFLKKYSIGKLLVKCGAGKEKGICIVAIFRYLLCLMFSDRSMYMQLTTKRFEEGYSKNTVYRFLNSCKTNWERFTVLLSERIVNKFLRPLTSEEREDVFIFDDSTYKKTGHKHTELVAKVFDHVSMKYIKGMLKMALKAGHRAKYVLFDSWFSCPKEIIRIKNECDLNTIAMIKKSSKINYIFNGEKLNIKQIFSKCKKRPGRSRYLLSVMVTVTAKDENGNEVTVPAKIVCVRNRSNRKDWLALICTNTELSEEEILRIYGKRWDIEVFFKTCKSMLKLETGCHSLSYDAMTAHVSIVFTRFMLLSVEKRMSDDDRTAGELFFLMCDEMQDITFSRSLSIIMQAFLDTLTELLQLTEDQLQILMDCFCSRLPAYLRYSLGITDYGS